MKQDPGEFWDNIPRKIGTNKSEDADVLREHTTAERVEEEKIAKRFND